MPARGPADPDGPPTAVPAEVRARWAAEAALLAEREEWERGRRRSRRLWWGVALLSLTVIAFAVVGLTLATHRFAV